MKLKTQLKAGTKGGPGKLPPETIRMVRGLVEDLARGNRFEKDDQCKNRFRIDRDTYQSISFRIDPKSYQLSNPLATIDPATLKKLSRMLMPKWKRALYAVGDFFAAVGKACMNIFVAVGMARMNQLAPVQNPESEAVTGLRAPEVPLRKIHQMNEDGSPKNQ